MTTTHVPTTEKIHHAFTRYYNEKPENKPVSHCRQHGLEHGVYRWSKQIDPRWSDEQIAAYREGYEKGLKIQKINWHHRENLITY